jgi:hypothetical protein
MHRMRGASFPTRHKTGGLGEREMSQLHCLEHGRAPTAPRGNGLPFDFIEPFLIGAGVTMPLSLTILGVLGGFFGLFIGPTLLAVAFALLDAWHGGPTATPETALAATPCSGTPVAAQPE